MIGKAQMMETLLEVCASFRSEWEAFLAYWKNEPVDPPLYIALSDFARHLIGMLARGETQEFAIIFAAVERLQIEGEDYVREAAVVGLLEDLQNLNLHSTTEPEQFRPFLGVESASAWDELYVLWNKVGVLKAAGLLEPETGSVPRIDFDSIQDPELRRIVERLYPMR